MMMFGAAAAVFIQLFQIPRKIDVLVLYGSVLSFLAFYIFENMLFLLSYPDKLGLWFWQETHCLNLPGGLDFFPAPITFLPIFLQFVFLIWRWRVQIPGLIHRAAVAFLFGALWIFPLDLEWIAFTAAKWWGETWYLGGAPWLHFLYELVAINAAVLVLLPLIKNRALFWDRWTAAAEVLNLVYLCFVFIPAVSPWSTDMNIWLDLRHMTAPPEILWTLRIPARLVNVLIWFIWVRPWRQIKG